MAISLQDWASGDTDYVATYNSNNSVLESAVGTLQNAITGDVALDASISPILKTLFGAATARIGPQSCLASISGVTVPIGVGFINRGGAQVLEIASSQVVDCASFGSVTIYISVDNIGVFSASESPSAYDIWSVVKSGSSLSTLTAIAPTVYAGTQPVEFQGFKNGAPAGSEVVSRWVTPRPVILKAGLSGSYCKAATAATASTTFTLAKNGSSIGTVVFAASGTVATFSFVSDVTTAAGDLLTLTAPSSPDATLANIVWSFLGYQVP